MAVTTVEVTAGQGLFRATGRIVKFDGYRKVLAPVGKSEDVTLPDVKEKDVLNRLDLFETQHFTQPPPRFSEASLVKALEKEGIGRPSTYSSIIGTIQEAWLRHAGTWPILLHPRSAKWSPTCW